MVSSKEKALLIACACLDKKGEDILLLDLKELSSIADYFVICSASSNRKAMAIADGVIEKLSSQHIQLRHKEGYEEALWVLLDYGDVVVHIFYSETRAFYGLERLWGDAPKLIFNG